MKQNQRIFFWAVLVSGGFIFSYVAITWLMQSQSLFNILFAAASFFTLITEITCCILDRKKQKEKADSEKGES